MGIRDQRLRIPYGEQFRQNCLHDDVNPWSICAGMPLLDYVQREMMNDHLDHIEMTAQFRHLK